MVGVSPLRNVQVVTKAVRCYWINVISLICGFLGNIFLLLNFTQRVRYIVALPATIILWYLSSGFLIAITVSMHMYSPPHQPAEGYTQGFWYAISAAVLYTVCSMLLMVNMLGHFMGHYGEEFKLSDSQRTLILQTMAFFIWLAGGAAVFARLERNVGEVWGFSDAVRILPVPTEPLPQAILRLKCKANITSYITVM